MTQMTTNNGRTFPMASGNTVQGHHPLHLQAHTKVLPVHKGLRGSALRFPLRASTFLAIIAPPAAHDANVGSWLG